ncbi:MAG: N-acetyl-anhydromuranmyl-L-alanine amidase [Betaproteobacteria bacterium]|nr:MAG: N-acetyl-anhydromuranmyl-L-alanine amidase [Betaproteobacteria bacterium]
MPASGDSSREPATRQRPVEYHGHNAPPVSDPRVPIALRPASTASTPARSRLSADGWLAGAARRPSPNCDERPAGADVTLVVVHGISLPPGEFRGDGVERLFTNRLDAGAHPYYASVAHLRVSAHFLVRRDGRVLQFVPCVRRAWHAGVSTWQGRERCNDFSVGVELEGTDTRAYTARQYHRLARIVRALRTRYPIAHVAGHSDVAPGRKSDPGPAFEWRRLRELLGVGPRARARA